MVVWSPVWADLVSVALLSAAGTHSSWLKVGSSVSVLQFRAVLK